MVRFRSNSHGFVQIVTVSNTYLVLLAHIVRLRDTKINQGNLEAVVKGNSHGRLGGMQLYNLVTELYVCYPDILIEWDFNQLKPEHLILQQKHTLT